MIYHARRAPEPDLSGLDTATRRTTKALKSHLDEFDSIVVQGMSGVVVGSVVALRLKKPLVIVRKSTEGSHAYQLLINGSHLGKRALFLDDFVSRGSTRARCAKAIKPRGCTIVATFEYDDYTYTKHGKIVQNELDAKVAYLLQQEADDDKRRYGTA